LFDSIVTNQEPCRRNNLKIYIWQKTTRQKRAILFIKDKLNIISLYNDDYDEPRQMDLNDLKHLTHGRRR